MKKTLLLFVSVLTLSLTGCLDVVEEISLAQNGSGAYKTTVDMSGMFDMIEMMASMDTSANEGLKKLKGKNFDSSFQFKSMTDTASKLTAEQKKFFSKATGHVRMNEEQRKFVIALNFPFDRPEDIGTLMNMTEGGKGLSMLGKSAAPGLAAGEDAMPSFDVYDWKFSKGLMEKKVNESKLAAFKANNKFKEMGDAQGMLSQMNMRTIIHLPAPAKKATGEKLTLSDDKMTITIKATVADVVQNPAALSYRVEY